MAALTILLLLLADITLNPTTITITTPTLRIVHKITLQQPIKMKTTYLFHYDQ